MYEYEYEYGLRPELAVTEPVDGVSVVKVRCELDMLTTPGLRQLLTQELSLRPRGVVLDLSNCEFLGSAALEVFVAAHEEATRHGAVFALAGLNQANARALEAIGLNTLLVIYTTLQHAVTTLAGG